MSERNQLLWTRKNTTRLYHLTISLGGSWIPKTLTHCYFIPKNSSLLSRKQLPVKEGDIVWASYIFHKTMALENIDDLVFWNIYFGISCLSWLYFSQDLDTWKYWYFEISISVFVVWAGFISHKTLTLQRSSCLWNVCVTAAKLGQAKPFILAMKEKIKY